ncbi:MAG: iron chelate uptake ABC transporter family permease subunit [Nitrospiraceae bacterium]|nr:iron chelate uptake ABC transporter family permease subunit [Nitrospiraceae bacterium]
MTRRGRRFFVALVVAGSIAMVLLSLLTGAEPLSVARAWREWRSGIPMTEAPTLSILVQQRMPRTLAALLVGSGLALVGCAFQAMLRNPLATPYTLGVASAGAFGAWTATVLMAGYGLTRSILGVSSVQVFAFVFAEADVLIVYFLAARKGKVSPTVLLLGGVTMGMLSNSGILLMRYLSDPERLKMMDHWLMGGVDVLGYGPVLTLLIGVAPCMAILLAQMAKFDQLGFGVEIAAGRGINVRLLQTSTFFVGSLMTAVIVSVAGPIGFVGLIVPHAVRSVTGSRHRILMPVSVIAGGGFLCFCDIVARKLLPGETPIGIVTTLLGGPFFLYLLLRRRFTDWGA